MQEFIVYLVSDLHLTFRTVKTYLYAVKDWACELGYKDPTLDRHGSKHLFNKMLKGAQRSCFRRPRDRRPLKRYHVRKILDDFERTSYCYTDKVAFRAALLLAYYGFMRASEYLRTPLNSRGLLRRKDVKFIKNQVSQRVERVKIRLRSTKNNQFSCTYIDIFTQISEWCPVTELLRYIDLIKPDKEGPLFLSAGYPFTAKRFNTMLRVGAAQSGFDPKYFSSHSLRSGAATQAGDASVPSWVIQRLGRWRSDCYTTYIKSAVRPIKVAQKAIRI